MQHLFISATCEGECLSQVAQLCSLQIVYSVAKLNACIRSLHAMTTIHNSLHKRCLMTTHEQPWGQIRRLR